jgi:hypothetical protein
MYVHTFGVRLSAIINYCHMKKDNFSLEINACGGYIGYLPPGNSPLIARFSGPIITPT